MTFRLFDVATASALSQILPIILLALMVELRRTKLHHRGRSVIRTRVLMAVFFTLFAVIETILVLSIDGHVYPFQWSDLVAALLIFAMLLLLFVLTFVPERPESELQRERRHAREHDNARDDRFTGPGRRVRDDDSRDRDDGADDGF